MLIPLGQLALFMALLSSALAVAAYLLAATRRDALAARTGRDALRGAAVALAGATAVLLIELWRLDFALSYVAGHADRALAPLYRVSALWAGAEGSLLLWALLMAAAAVAYLGFRPLTQRTTVAGAVFALLLLFFTLLLNSGANPFVTLPEPPINGSGLRLALQTWPMVAHPPILFAGYAALAVPLVIALGNLLTGRLGDSLLTARRYLLIGWSLLTAGIALGAWWAYTDLGWGGYWAWDPVENASLLPWLLATAALHTMASARRGGKLLRTTLTLCVLAFLSAILATYITRGGIKESLHAYAPDRFTALYGYFAAIVTLVMIALLIWRRPRPATLRPTVPLPPAPPRTEPAPADRAASSAAQAPAADRPLPMAAPVPAAEAPPERPSLWPPAMILVALVLEAFALAVLAGTILPALSTKLSGGPVIVTIEKFNRLGGVFGLMVLGYLACGSPLVRLWRAGYGLRQLVELLRFPAGAAVVAAVAMQLLADDLGLWGTLTAALAAAAAVGQLVGLRQTLKSLPAVAAVAAHLGLVALCLGVAGSHLVSLQTTVELSPGETITVGRYDLRFDGMDKRLDEPRSRLDVWANLTISQDGAARGALRPARRFNLRSDEAQARVAIRSAPLRDLYVSLDSYRARENRATLTVRQTALVPWIWVGVGLLTVAGLLAAATIREPRRLGLWRPQEDDQP